MDGTVGKAWDGVYVCINDALDAFAGFEARDASVREDRSKIKHFKDVGAARNDKANMP